MEKIMREDSCSGGLLKSKINKICKHSNWRAIGCWLPVMLLPLFLYGCQDNASNKNIAPEKLTLSYTTQPQCTLIHVAQAKGFFTANKLEIQPVLHSFGKAALQLLLDGKADLATAAETPIMFNILKGENIDVLANIEASSTNNAIVARKDAGIDQPKALQGKRIGYSPGTTSDFFLSTFLNANGIDRNSVQLHALKPEEMQGAITAKQVDAVSTWNYPLAQIQQALATEIVTFYDKDIYTETYNLVAKKEYIKQHPETIKRFLRALIQAEEFTHNHPDEAQTIVSEASKVDKALVKQVWNSFGYRVLLDQILLIMLEDETRWAISNRIAAQKEMPDYLSHIHFDALRAVKPEAIRIKR
jgi:ABC-type nitrate/sulfonate/bicarbonate transport system substrate-binding protein